jgi:hypothetical protein
MSDMKDGKLRIFFSRLFTGIGGFYLIAAMLAAAIYLVFIAEDLAEWIVSIFT